MKRFLPFLMLFFVFVFLPISASAAENENTYGLNIMDYSTVNNSGSNFFSFQNTKQINIDIPGSYYTTYVDIVYCVSGGAAPTLVQNKWNTTLNNLTIQSIGRGYYRAYGTVRVSTYYSLDLVFTTGNAASTTYIEIFSCIVRGNGIHFDISARLEVFAYNASETYYYYPDAGGVNTISFNGVSGNIYDNQFQLYINAQDWSAYDYLDFTVLLHVKGISSISAIWGSQVLPIQVTYLSNDSNVSNDFLFTVRIDCRGLNRTVDDYPLLIIAGNCISDNINQVDLLSAGGMLSIDYSDPAFPWYSKILSHLSSSTNSVLAEFTDVLTAISGQNSLMSDLAGDITAGLTHQEDVMGVLAGRILDAFTNQNNVINIFSSRVDDLFEEYWGGTGAGAAAQDNAAQIKEDLTGGLDAASSFDKPSSSQLNRYLDFNGAISNTAILTSTGFLTAVFDVPVISKVLSLCMLFALAATILFGKR